MHREEKKIGELIVGKIDSLIYLIKKAVLLGGDDRKRLISEGYNVVQDLALLLGKVLGDNSEFTVPAIRELLRQRLAGDTSGIDKGIFEILEEMLSWCESRAAERTISSAGTTRVCLAMSSDDNSSCDELQKAIFYLFPGMKVLRNHRLFGVSLEYYVPALNIAVIDDANGKGSQEIKSFICKNYGIRLIRVNTRELNGYREIARYIKRRLRI